jgi:hypothetical protein
MRSLVCLALLFAPVMARADSVYRDPNDPGRVTNIGRGVWELDVGALGVLAVDNEGDTSVTRLSTDFSAQIHYFIKNNLSIGVEALFDFDDNGDSQSSTAFGGAIDATVHLRLGLGAFFRPGIAIGALAGHRNIPLMDGTVDQASQVGLITRLALPIAYFASPRLLLQAGPQINVTAGSFTPTGGDAQSFTRIAGGFSVGLGYVF